MIRKVEIVIELRDNDADFEDRLRVMADAAITRAVENPSLPLLLEADHGPIFCRPAHGSDTSSLVIIHPAR